MGRVFHPGRSHGCCPVCALWGLLPCERCLLAPVTGNKEGSKSRVKPTPTRFPTNSRSTPMDNTPLHSISSVCHPWRRSWCYCLLESMSWMTVCRLICQVIDKYQEQKRSMHRVLCPQGRANNFFTSSSSKSLIY